MNKSEAALKKNEILILTILGICALALVVLSAVPDLRNSVREYFISSDRKILSKVVGSITPQGPHITVLKIKEKNQLALEVYTNVEGQPTIFARIPLFESRDGHFLLKGNATNLALTDIDGDSTLEIVAPTYDDQMVPRLNIFKYNSSSGSFDRVSAPDSFNP